MPQGSNRWRMRSKLSVFGLLALISALAVGASTPAAAKFWGCKDDEQGKVLAEWTTDSHGRVISGKRTTNDYSAKPKQPRATFFGTRRSTDGYRR